MSSATVSNAGGRGAAVNGTYALQGELNEGRPVYRSDQGQVLFFAKGCWRLNKPNHGGIRGHVYAMASESNTPPMGKWKCSGGFNGEDMPQPEVRIKRDWSQGGQQAQAAAAKVTPAKVAPAKITPAKEAAEEASAPTSNIARPGRAPASSVGPGPGLAKRNGSVMGYEGGVANAKARAGLVDGADAKPRAGHVDGADAKPRAGHVDGADAKARAGLVDGTATADSDGSPPRQPAERRQLPPRRSEHEPNWTAEQSAQAPPQPPAPAPAPAEERKVKQGPGAQAPLTGPEKQYVVSGAGGRGVAVNGKFVAAGEHNGVALYRHVDKSNGSVLYFGKGHWRLNKGGNGDTWGTVYAAACGDDQVEPLLGRWKCTGGINGEDLPKPTLKMIRPWGQRSG